MLLIVVGMLFSTEGRAQSLNRKMTLTDVIYTAHEQSPSALVAKHNFLGNYWAYRSYKAQFLPSLNLGATLGNFNRSLMALQNSETGNIKYVENNNMRNNLTLSLDQNIALTGGKVSVFTQLNRLDQYAPERNITYNSQPINITYIQPLRAFNSLKWQKKTQPKEYDGGYYRYGYFAVFQRAVVAAEPRKGPEKLSEYRNALPDCQGAFRAWESNQERIAAT